MYRTLLLLVFSIPLLLLAQNDLTKFQDHGKVGYKDAEGKIQIEAQFNYGSEFMDGSAIIVLNGKRGLIDDKGDYLIKPKFEDLSSFSHGIASAKLDGKYGFVNEKGEWVLEAKFDEAYAFRDGLARVKAGRYYGFVDTNMELVIATIYVTASDFKRGKAAVQMEEGATYSYIKTDGAIAFDGLFEIAYAFHTEVATVRLCGKWYEIDEEGIIIGEIEERREEHEEY